MGLVQTMEPVDFFCSRGASGGLREEGGLPSKVRSLVLLY